jgi:Ca-activated chloride channel family protein
VTEALSRAVLIALFLALITAVVRRWRESRRLCDLRRLQLWAGAVRVGSASDIRWRWAAALSVVAAVFCCGLATVWPIDGEAEMAEGYDRGPDLVIVLDTSKSMFASDLPTSRIHEAIRQLDDVVRAAPVARIGLVAFAGSAVVVCPLTLDRDAVSSVLTSLEREPVGGQGSALALGLDRAMDVFAEVPPTGRILLVSDGEDTAGDLESAIGHARSRGLHIDSVGVGTIVGAAVPIAPGVDGFQVDPADPKNHARTTLNEATLTSISAQSGGSYRRLTVGVDLAGALRPILLGSPSSSGRRTNDAVGARVLLSVAFVLLAVELTLRIVRTRSPRLT